MHVCRPLAMPMQLSKLELGARSTAQISLFAGHMAPSSSPKRTGSLNNGGTGMCSVGWRRQRQSGLQIIGSDKDVLPWRQTSEDQIGSRWIGSCGEIHMISLGARVHSLASQLEFTARRLN